MPLDPTDHYIVALSPPENTDDRALLFLYGLTREHRTLLDI